MKDNKEFKEKLNRFFRELRKEGYIAKQNYGCCRSCVWAELPKESNAVFYSTQNSVKEGSKYVWLSWRGNGKQICGIAEKSGLLHHWDGDEETSIMVIDKDLVYER